MNGDDYSNCSDCISTGTKAEGDHASDDGQGFKRGNLRGLAVKNLHGVPVSEPPTDNSSGLQESPDHTLVYNAVYQSCRDLTACGSWDEICCSTPNRKSKLIPMKNLSVTSINASITEYASSYSSHKVAQVPERGASLCIIPDIPIFPTIECSYPPGALLTTHDLTGSLSTYIPLAKLGLGVHGKVFAVRLKDDPDDNIYTLKTIRKASLEQRGVAEVTKELWILRFITDASLSNKPFPFLQRLKENFQDEKTLFIVLEYFPTTLAHTETALPFRLSQNITSTSPVLLHSPSKTYQSEQEAIQALRFLAAELTLGLLFLHRHGIVHQDIKPANIMISEGGHAVIGDFGAASALPLPCQPDRVSFKRSRSPSGVDKDGVTYGSIVLQPQDTVTFTPLYAAPELLERKEDGSLIYDERADWWSLGISLYEITTGGVPFHISSDAVSIGKGRKGGLFFELLEGLDLTRYAAQCDTHLDGYLRSLLVHDPSQRLSGERAKSHPFLEPLQDIWAEVEDLKHPPCPEPSARVVCTGDTDLSFDLQEDSSKFDVPGTQISQALESPQSSVDREFYTPREAFSSPEQNSLESPSIARRMEVMDFKRSGGQVLWNDTSATNSNRLQESGSSVILQQEAFMSYYIESSFQTNRSLSVGNHLPSPASAGQFFSEEHSYGICSMQRQGVGIPEESFEEEIIRAEASFTDSGLNFPMGASPESWGHRKTDLFRKPVALRSIYGKGFQGPSKDKEGRILHNESMPEPEADHPTKPDWTFDEKITIALLEASLREREISEVTVKRRLSKPTSVAAVSEKIIKAAGRRVADTLKRRR